ncbi:hypothetical protein UN64_00475 [Fictibacillus arsenicus]|uniref:Uncharacterized protein n=1 Tax=Fictibacillus arsenicus TaxID=255247 RepID=A0A1V3GA83_9BACL|nr:hypothetical protein UN64_00475 [Fictibacillus arsenicus]
MRDSCGTSGTGETPKGAKRQEAHRPPRGKRVPGAEINHFQEQHSLRKQPLDKIKNSHPKKQGREFEFTRYHPGYM